MNKYESIKLNKTFRYLYAKGETVVSETVVIYVKKNNLGKQRLGITTGKKIGKAVQRNRARRVIRVAYRSLLPHLSNCYDMVIVARTRCVSASSKKVTEDLKKCFKKAKMITNEKNS